VQEEYEVREFDNGLTLLGRRMENVSSAAFTFSVPAGVSHDPPEAGGSAAIAAEWLFRGAGERDTRALNDALDALGCQHNEAVQSEHIHLSGALLGRNLEAALGLYAEILRTPRLDEETFEPCVALTAQDLASLEDEPARKCNILLQEKFYPVPLGRCVFGTLESLRNISPAPLRDHLRKRLGPHGTMLAVAGNLDWPCLCAMVEKLFADWSIAAPAPAEIGPADGGFTHIRKDSAQTHITLAHRSVPIEHERYYAARMAETVLSVGMSSRLFTEVREKRGLAYHVATSYHSLKGLAGMFTYAGTVPDKAQETFDVTVAEIHRLAEGVTQEELTRARTQLKSSLIMQGESTAARAGALVGDWYHLRRVRSLRELSEEIDAVSADDVAAYLREYPAEDFTVLVIGPEPVDVSSVAAG